MLHLILLSKSNNISSNLVASSTTTTSTTTSSTSTTTTSLETTTPKGFFETLIITYHLELKNMNMITISLLKILSDYVN